jgi:hypothetical protein
MNSAVPAGLVVFLSLPTFVRGYFQPHLSKLAFSMVGCRPFCLRSAARWRDLRLILGVFKPWWKRRPTLCHPSASLGMTKGGVSLPCASMCIRRLVEGPAVKSLIFSGP